MYSCSVDMTYDAPRVMSSAYNVNATIVGYNQRNKIVILIPFFYTFEKKNADPINRVQICKDLRLKKIKSHICCRIIKKGKLGPKCR